MKRYPADETKRSYFNEWVMLINDYGGFGIWRRAVSKVPADVAEIMDSISYE